MKTNDSKITTNASIKVHINKKYFVLDVGNSLVQSLI